MAKKPEPLTGDEELQNVLRMNAFLRCTGTHRSASGRLMPCASPASLARISDRAEPEKKGSRKKRRTRYENLRKRGVLGIDTLPGGGLVSAPIIIKVAKDTPRANRRKPRSDRAAAIPAAPKDRIVDPEFKNLGRRGLRRLAGRSIGNRGGRGGGRSFRPGDFNPEAWDGNNDGVVQDGTRFERPAVPDTGLPLGDSLPFERPEVPNVERPSGGGVRKAGTSAAALKNRFKEIEDRVTARFGPIKTRPQALAALREVFPNTEFEIFAFKSELEPSEIGAVLSLVDLGIQYPKTAQSLYEIETDYDLKSFAQFTTRTDITEDGQRVFSTNVLTFRALFFDYVDDFRFTMTELREQKPDNKMFFSIAEEIDSMEDLDDETKDRLLSAALVAHEFGHAWHDRSTRPEKAGGEEQTIISFFASLYNMYDSQFEMFLAKGISAAQGRNFTPPRPNVDGMSQAEASKALADWNKGRKDVNTRGLVLALDQIYLETGKQYMDYRDDGLTKGQVSELLESTTTSDYATTNFNESVAESFAAEYLGLTFTRPKHFDTLWNYMNQTKTAETSNVQKLPGGIVVERDEDGVISAFVDNICTGFIR